MGANKIWVVIPTYWGPSGLGVYDHPTPIDGSSTLPALLISLVEQKFSSPFNVLVLVSAVSKEYEQQALSAVTEIVRGFRGELQICIADAGTARKVDDFLTGQQSDLGIRKMVGYAAVRNMQLLVPALYGAEVIIALDDDEVVLPNYLSRAVKWIGKQVGGNNILGLVGPYLDDEDSPFLNEPQEVGNLLLAKAVLMNRTIRGLIESPEDLPVTPIGFGGNMVLHQEVFTRVGFDPGITRGEDIDYIINAWAVGIPFHFDAKLTVIHRPPRQFEAPMYAKLRQDVFRFIYEHHKINLFGLSSEELSPYPGGLFTDDFPEFAREALELAAQPELVAKFGTPEEIIATSHKMAAHNLAIYQDFTRLWPIAIKRIIDQSQSSSPNAMSYKFGVINI